MKLGNKLKLYLFSGISLLTIIGIIFYICQFTAEKQLVLSDKDKLFVYLFASTIIVLLFTGIILGYLLCKIYKQNFDLLGENAKLQCKIDNLEKLIKILFSQINNNMDDIEDNVIKSIRETEDTIINIIEHK